MVILMKSNKTLVISKNSRLYQQENAVDKIVFYVPEFYEENDLKEFVASLCYTSPSNHVRSELLVAQEESDKEGFIEYKLPVTTRITELSGNIPMYLSLLHADQETNKKYVLKTSVVNITIETWEDYFKYVDDNTLTAIDNKILELDNEIAKLKTVSDTYISEKPDDLTIDDEGHLQLTANGTEIGEGVHVVVNPTDYDEQYDGILDLDELTDGISPEPSPTPPSGDSELDLTIDQNGRVQITSDGRPIGTGVDVIVNPDDKDEVYDGILDLDSLIGN